MSDMENFEMRGVDDIKPDLDPPVATAAWNSGLDTAADLSCSVDSADPDPGDNLKPS